MTDMVKLNDVKQMWAESDDQTLSLFLDVNPGLQENQATNPAWRTFLKQALRDAANEAQTTGSWKQIEARVNAFFEDYRVASRGLAAFFSPEGEQVYEFPITVGERWAFGKPLLVPLLWLIDEYEPYLIVMVDKENAELVTAYLGTSSVQGKLENDMYSYDFGQKTLMPSASAVAGGHMLTQGSNREAYEDMINEHIARFHREVVSEVAAFTREHPGIRIVIGGEEHAAHALRNLMPDRFEGELVGVLPLPMRMSSSEILDNVLPAAVEFERRQEMKLVTDVIDLAKSGGRGALGREAVQQALEMQQVELLILPYPLNDEETATEASARAFESGGSVELVYGAAADRLREEGGVAARLYYAL